MTACLGRYRDVSLQRKTRHNGKTFAVTVSYGDHNICFRKLENACKNLIFCKNLDSLKQKLDSPNENLILCNENLISEMKT